MRRSCVLCTKNGKSDGHFSCPVGTAFGTFDSALGYNGCTSYQGKGGIHEIDSKAAGSADSDDGVDRGVGQTWFERIGRGAESNRNGKADKHGSAKHHVYCRGAGVCVRGRDSGADFCEGSALKQKAGMGLPPVGSPDPFPQPIPQRVYMPRYKCTSQVEKC